MRTLSEAKTALAVQQYREATRDLGNPEPEAEPPVCHKHNWNPPRRGPQPRPRASMCPACIREADHVERKPPPTDGYERRELPTAQDVKRTPAIDSAWARHQEAQAAAGVVLPGSKEEEELVSELDVERELAIRADHPKRGKVASQRIIGGELVVFYHSPKTLAAWRRKGSSGRGKVAPVWPRGEDDGKEITVDASSRWQR